jgi:DNA repair protein RadC
LLALHGSVGGIFAALPDGVAPVVSDAPRAAGLLGAARAVMLASLKAEFAEAPIVRARAVIDYLRGSMAFTRTETARVLYLDASHRLILESVTSRGSKTSVPLSTTDIVRTAVTVDASGILLAHNHPSGNPRPSLADKTMTAVLLTKLSTVGVMLHDHLIFGRYGWVSFRALGLLDRRTVD